MALNFLKKLFGDTSEKEIKKLEPIINAIEGYAESYAKMSDEELKAKTDFFKSELASGKTLDDILPDAFAVSDSLRGRRVVLVDDVYTTGATVRAALAALRRAGARPAAVALWTRRLVGGEAQSAWPEDAESLL